MPNGGVQPIGDAAVVGAGAAGRGIALSLALGGFEVVLVDSSQEKLRRAVDDILIALRTLEDRGMSGRWRQPCEREYFDRQPCEHILPRTSFDDAMKQVGFAVEALPEDLELKRGVLAELERHCRLEPSLRAPPRPLK